MRRIGVLMNRAADNPEGQARLAAFQQALQQLGWSDGRNVRIDVRWAADVDRERRYAAAELVALAPDIILAGGTVSVAAVQQASRSVPIVFASGKWLELLKEVAPGVKRAAVLRDPANAAGIGQFGAIQTAASSLGVEVSAINVRDAGEIERAAAAFAGSANGGLIVTGDVLATAHGDLIITLAARHKLPAVYGNRFSVTGGGLVSYAADFVDQYRRAAGYVDRILKGEKPADLPVQAPTKYELVVNLKTAKALGLTIPSTVLSRADEVIE